MTHTVSKEGLDAGGLPELGTQSSEASLRNLAESGELADALSNKDSEGIKRIFKKFYEDHPGIYGIQWVDANGINLYGYPEENSPLNYDFHSLKIPSSKPILNALSGKKESSFDVPLIEGKEGRFFMAPVYKGEVYLGMVYIIRIKP